jgi:all-trans-retinol dehydrogenase (NAD+)
MIAVYLKFLLSTIITLLLASYYGIISLVKQFVPYKYRIKKDVKGKNVLITGSGSGLGKLTAKKLAKLGAHLVLVDIDEKNNKQTQDEIIKDGGKAEVFKCDLSNRDEIYTVAEEIKKQCGDIYILINNAGVVTGKKLLESPDDKIDLTFKVNVLAHIWLTKSFLPKMIENNDGHIVCISSILGLFGCSTVCDYSASKFACLGFTESLRNELIRLDRTNIKTTIVCPALMDTGMFTGTATTE